MRNTGLSFFPMSVAVMEAHRKELEPHRTSKGTVQFKPDKPLPAALVRKLVIARLEENRKGKRSRSPAAGRERHPMPACIKQALEARGLVEAYEERPPYQRNDYIGWITQAKQESTRQKRLDQMLDELAAGDSYMKMPYEPSSRRSK